MMSAKQGGMRHYTIYLETLGCAKNLVDSEVMLGVLSCAGYGLTAQPDQADIIVVNTCAFIETAVSEAIDTILRLAGHKQSGTCSHLVVCGCLPQRYEGDLAAALPEVDLFLGTGEVGQVARHLQKLTSSDLKTPGLHTRRASFLMTASTPRIISSPGSSTYIKIAEGCSHRCTFCTIPAIRGPYKSRPAGSVVREARRLAANGISELNIIAQDTSQYPDLPVLLQRIAAIPGIAWIRLLYCHPRNVTAKLLEVIASEEKVCDYLDLPLQHAADSVLRRMGRGFSRKKTVALLQAIRETVPTIALRTTFIVGFPGETERDFSELLDFVREEKFQHVGAFMYRDEEGTAALHFGNKVPEESKKSRYHDLMSLQAGIARKHNARLVGRQLEVLVDDISPREPYRLQARAQFQAPDVDGVVFLHEDVPVGEFQQVMITKSFTYDLVGTII